MEFERRNNLFSLFISLAMAVKGMPDGFSFFKHTKLYFFHGSVFVLDDFFFFFLARNVSLLPLLLPCEFIQGQSCDFLLFYFTLFIITRPAKPTLNIIVYTEWNISESALEWELGARALVTAVLMTCSVTLSQSFPLSGHYLPLVGMRSDQIR